MFYDFPEKNGKTILSHARAFSTHPDFNIVGAIDKDPKKLEDFKNIYKSLAYSDISDLSKIEKIDVVVIATPTKTHLDVLQKVLSNTNPKLILCEKPLAYNTEEAEEMVMLCEEKRIPIYMNFIRRSDPGIIKVRKQIEIENFQLPFKAFAWYSGGLLNNGSHLLDLLILWFGPVQGWQVINSGVKINEHDAQPDFLLNFSHGSAFVSNISIGELSHHTVEVLFSNGRLRYEHDGSIFWQRAEHTSSLDQNKRILKSGKEIEHDMGRYQYNVASQVRDALQSKRHTLSSGQIGLDHVRLLNHILKYKKEIKI